MYPVERITQRTGGHLLREDFLAPERRVTHHVGVEEDHSDDEDFHLHKSGGMSHVLGVFAKVAKFSLHYDDDFFDRVSHRYTLGVLVIATVIVSTKQYVGEPIKCWCPATFLESQEEYANNVCWISNTYYVPADDDLPRHIPERHDKELSYYQWVPFILLTMSALFFLPHLLWRFFCGKIGLDCNGMVCALNNATHTNPENRNKIVGYVVQHMDRYLEYQREYRSGCCTRLQNALSRKWCMLWGKRYGNQIVTVYLFIKLVYICNAVIQLFIMNLFLRTDYSVYGIEVLTRLVNGTDWKESRRFPRITMCDFEIRRLGGLNNIHRYTVQCALSINLFNEKIFLILWFWFVLVAFLSCWGILPWLLSLFHRTRKDYVKKYLSVTDKYTKNERVTLKAFIENYLRQDGVFVLRIISKNTDDIVIAEIIVALWDYFRKRKKVSSNGQGNGTASV